MADPGLQLQHRLPFLDDKKRMKREKRRCAGACADAARRSLIPVWRSRALRHGLVHGAGASEIHHHPLVQPYKRRKTSALRGGTKTLLLFHFSF